MRTAVWLTVTHVSSYSEPNVQWSSCNQSKHIGTAFGYANFIIHEGVTIFVQGLCRSSSQISTNRHALKCAYNFCSDIMKKERHSCNRQPHAMRHGCTLWTCKQTSKHGVETHVITQDQEIYKCAFCRQSEVGAVLGLQWTHPWALPGSWTDDQ
jgi:hypothetical protein